MVTINTLKLKIPWKSTKLKLFYILSEASVKISCQNV